MKEKQRNYYFDNLKAFLIFCVVAGHALQAFSKTELCHYIYLVIFSFHMPLFIFVSGFFARESLKKTIAKFLPLYVIFQILQTVVDFLCSSYTEKSWQKFDLQFLIPQWTMWYLLALIGFQFLLPLFNTNNRKQQIRNLILALVIALIVPLSPFSENILAVVRIFTFLPYYLLGYYLAKEEKTRQLFSTDWRMSGKNLWICRSVAAIAVVIMLLGFWIIRDDMKATWFYGKESYADSSLTVWIRLLSYAVALVWLFVLWVWIPRRRLPVIEGIGKNTLGIYLFHTLFLLIILAAISEKELPLTGIFLISVVMTLFFSIPVFTRVLNVPGKVWEKITGGGKR